jgi:multiple sugar transport system substrate-binding protein
MKFIKIFGLLIPFAILASALAQSPIKVVFWDFFGGGDGVRMKQIIADFNKSQTDIQIENSTLPWGAPFYTKIHTSVVAGQTPDLMTYHMSAMPRGIKGGDLRPFSDAELSSVGLSRASFLPSLVQTALSISKIQTGAEKLYAVPLDTHTLVMYYNKDILKKAGLLGTDGVPTGMTGIANFTKALAQIKAKTGVLPVATSSAGGDSASPWRIFSTLFNQQGGTFVSNGKLSLTDLDTKGKSVLSVMAGWTKDGLIAKNTAYPAMVALFTAGRAAFMINGNWEVPTMVDLKAKGKLFDYGIMPFPKLYNNQKTWADSHTLAIPNNTKTPMTPEKLKAVMTFIAYIQKTGGLTWAGGGHIPADIEVQSSPEYKQLTPNVEYSAKSATDVVLEPTVPMFGVGGPVYDSFGNSMVPALVGQLTVEQAIAKFKQQLTSFDK